MALLFEIGPELEGAFSIVDRLRRVFDCRHWTAADQTFVAWRRGLATATICSFDTRAAYLHGHWPAVHGHDIAGRRKRTWPSGPTAQRLSAGQLWPSSRAGRRNVSPARQIGVGCCASEPVPDIMPD